MDYNTQDAYRGMISGQHEVAIRQFKVVQGKTGHTWYIPVNDPEAGANIHVDVHNPQSDGYGGRVIEFLLEDGSVAKAKGPWHSNADSLFEDTGVDLRNTLWTFIVIGRGMDGWPTVVRDVVYQDPPKGKIGNFDRWQEVVRSLVADGIVKDGEKLFYYSQSRGGSSAGMVHWNEVNSTTDKE